VGLVLLGILAFIAYDHAQVQQIYWPSAQRYSVWRDQALQVAQRAWLFRGTALFAQVTTTPVHEGNARAMLTAERSALNTVQHLSGIATMTRAYVDAIAGTGATLLDTRKTIPGLRVLEKYATRMGGATNHRMRLDDGVELALPHDDIRRAKLVLTDALIAATARPTPTN
jgi:nicotinate-nucleotide pyrophosphorylase